MRGKEVGRVERRRQEEEPKQKSLDIVTEVKGMRRGILSPTGPWLLACTACTDRETLLS